MLFDYLNTENRRPVTKDYIKDQFLRDYIKGQNLAKISVSGLIKECHISRGTFYFYFSDIEDLYRQIEEELVDFTTIGLNEVELATISGNRERYLKTYTDYLTLWVENQEILNAFFSGSEGQSFFKALKDSVIGNFGECIRYAIGQNYADSREKMERFFAYGHVGMLAEWVQEGCVAEKQEVAETVADVLFTGWLSGHQTKKSNSNQ